MLEGGGGSSLGRVDLQRLPLQVPLKLSFGEFSTLEPDLPQVTDWRWSSLGGSRVWKFYFLGYTYQNCLAGMAAGCAVM